MSTARSIHPIGSGPYEVTSPNGVHRFPTLAEADTWARESAVVWPGARVALSSPNPLECATYHPATRAECTCGLDTPASSDRLAVEHAGTCPVYREARA